MEDICSCGSGLRLNSCFEVHHQLLDVVFYFKEIRQSVPVQFPGDKQAHMEDAAIQPKDPVESGRDPYQALKSVTRGRMQNHRISTAATLDENNDDHGKIDLNMRPLRTLGQASNPQVCIFGLCVLPLSLYLFICFLYIRRKILKLFINHLNLDG